MDGKLALGSNPELALPLIPYDLTKYIKPDAFTGDIVHRFYHQQLQIDNGKLEPPNGNLGKFVTWSDNPGLVLSYFDALANNVTANSKLFQFHHQPFAYYTKYAPFEEPPTKDGHARDYSPLDPPKLNPATTGPKAHLQDEQDFFKDVASGKLAPVSFIKPQGPDDEHPGMPIWSRVSSTWRNSSPQCRRAQFGKTASLSSHTTRMAAVGITWFLQCAKTVGVLACAFLRSLSRHSCSGARSTAPNTKPFPS